MVKMSAKAITIHDCYACVVQKIKQSANNITNHLGQTTY